VTGENAFQDTPEDRDRKVNRNLGLVEDVPCEACETILPFRKLNLFSLEELGYFFLCDTCCERLVLAPFREHLKQRLEEPGVSETFEKVLGEASLWADNPSERLEAFQALRRHFRRKREAAGGSDDADAD
jgi:hypothetical protein